MAVMQAESSCNPNARGVNENGTDDVGLFQINEVHVGHLISSQDRYDPSKNIKAAFAVYRGSGWKAWSVFNNGRYLSFL